MNMFISAPLALVVQLIFFLLIYYVDDFRLRVIMLAGFEVNKKYKFKGMTGFLSPLFSTIKAKIIEERHRALLMSVFRLPVNAYFIFALASLQYVHPLDVIIIII